MPLDGSSQRATITPLMKDDGYTFCELPRVNPRNKVLLRLTHALNVEPYSSHWQN